MAKPLIQFNMQSLLDHSFEEGCTQSEMTTLDNCGQLWFWRYGMLLRRKGGFSWALAFGSAMHTALEEMYATKGKRWSVPDLRTFLPKGMPLTTKHMMDLSFWQNVANVQADCYSRYYKDDFEAFEVEKAEIVVDIVFEWRGQSIRLKGMIDLKFLQKNREGMWMMDHKTTARMDLKTVQGWDFRFQFMFYLWLMTKYEEQQGGATKFRGYVINAIKKPTIRIKQKETADEFYERLRNEMLMEPEKYYYRETMLLNADSLNHFEEHVLGPKLNRIMLLTNPEVSDTVKSSIVNNMNTDNCQRYGVCEFLPLCAHGFDLEGFQYEQRPAKHEELEGEAEE